LIISREVSYGEASQFAA